MLGQASSEHLVIIGAVLLVALVAVVLVSGILSGSPGKSESDNYWQGARPFSIKEHSQQGSTMYLTLFNTEPDARIVNSITVGNASSSFNFSLAPGGSNAFSVTGLRACDSSYKEYEYQVRIYYSSFDVSGQVQTGAKPLSGTCAG